MANKKSFILYYDSLDVIEELTDEQVWKLFRKMKSYYNWNTYKTKDKIVDIVFIQFKNQFDRDLEKYEKICERNKQNIEKRWLNNANENTSGKSGIRPFTKNTYSDNDNEKDNDTVWNFLRKISNRTIREKVQYELKMYKSKFPNKTITNSILENILEKYNE